MQRESIIDACQIHSKPFRLVFPPDIEKKQIRSAWLFVNPFRSKSSTGRIPNQKKIPALE